jgi:hypothetical protein
MWGKIFNVCIQVTTVKVPTIHAYFRDQHLGLYTFYNYMYTTLFLMFFIVFLLLLYSKSLQIDHINPTPKRTPKMTSREITSQWRYVICYIWCTFSHDDWVINILDLETTTILEIFILYVYHARVRIGLFRLP